MLLKQGFIFTNICLILLVLSLSDVEASQKIPGLDKQVQKIMEQGHFPGVALAVLKKGKPIHLGYYGMADLSNNIPVTQNTVFELASLTKHMTALAIMTLVKQDKLTLDTRLVEFIEDAPPEWQEITVDQLLSHKAGLAHRFEQLVDGGLLLEYSRDKMLASAKKTAMVAKPGADWNYSDQGYFLLGIIIEAVTNKPFSEYMDSQFFQPLWMEQTRLLDQQAIIPFLSQGYAWKDGQLFRNRRVWQFELTSHFGVLSSLRDMLKWEAELVTPTIMNAEALEATWQLQRVFDAGDSCDTWGYARGWMAHIVDGRRILTHGGYAGTAYIRDVDSGLAIIVLTNREDTPDALSPFAIGWAAFNKVDPTISAGGLKCWQ